MSTNNTDCMLPTAARKQLSEDLLLAPLLKRISIEERPDFGGDVYFSLIRAIVYQQLSGKAAAAIMKRFLDLFPENYPYADQLLALNDESLRAAGLSRRKVAYIRNVVVFFQEEQLFTIDWSTLDDSEILSLLTAIKGVGQWTVEMVLIFTLHRPDLLPLDDLVVRNRLVAFLELEHLKGKAQVEEIKRIAERWRPYRSWVSRLMYAWEHDRRRQKT